MTPDMKIVDLSQYATAKNGTTATAYTLELSAAVPIAIYKQAYADFLQGVLTKAKITAATEDGPLTLYCDISFSEVGLTGGAPPLITVTLIAAPIDMQSIVAANPPSQVKAYTAGLLGVAESVIPVEFTDIFFIKL